MSTWQHIYEHFDVVAFYIFGLPVHWYGICYVAALLLALILAKFFARHFDLAPARLDAYFLWVELGVILGARLGFVLLYDERTWWYLARPWQIFNPFEGGEFVGIRGMSFHGAIVGFLLATWLFCRRGRSGKKGQKRPENMWTYLDLIALSVPLAYVLGRLGNFLNQELIGRPTEAPWGIYVAGVLRHPSQLYEALLEGLGVFCLVYFVRSFSKNPFPGQLIITYAWSYALARFICEFYREPDANLGLIFAGLSMGQILSLAMFAGAWGLYFYLKKGAKIKPSLKKN